MKFNTTAFGTITDLISGEVWTSSRLSDEIKKRISFYKENGISRGHRVAITYGGTPCFFADLFALWSVGACVACLNPHLTQGEVENVATFINAKAIVVDKLSPLLDQNIGRTVVCSETGFQEHHQINSDHPSTNHNPAASNLDDEALILFTSGTTGTPKGVLHTFRSLFARVTLNQYHISREALANSLCVLPTHFGHGLIGNCLTPLLMGGNLFLYPDTGIKVAPALGQILCDHDITFMSSVPTFWKIVQKFSKPPTHQTLIQVHIGSSPLSVNLWRNVQDWTGTQNVHNMYGITETANWLAGASSLEFDIEEGLIGKVWGGQAAVLGAEGHLQTQGEGELVVQSPALMQGYVNQQDLTLQSLRDGWFHTGDIGRIDDKGVIYLTGRLKSEINKAGMKVHPEEIDVLLERHPDVVEACCFGVPDMISGELVGVALVLEANAGFDKKQFQAWCAERIKKDCIPDKWFCVEAIAKTDRGKINRDTVMQDCLTENKLSKEV